MDTRENRTWEAEKPYTARVAGVPRNPPLPNFAQGDYPQIAWLEGDVPVPGEAVSYRQDGRYSLPLPTPLGGLGGLDEEWGRPQAVKERVQPGMGGPPQSAGMGVGGNISEIDVLTGEEAAVVAATDASQGLVVSPNLGGTIRSANYVRDQDGRFWITWDVKITLPDFDWVLNVEQYFRDGAKETYVFYAVTQPNPGKWEIPQNIINAHPEPQKGDSMYMWLTGQFGGELDNKMVELEIWDSVDNPPWHEWFTRKDYFGLPNWAWVAVGGVAAGVGVAAVTRRRSPRRSSPQIIVVKK